MDFRVKSLCLPVVWRGLRGLVGGALGGRAFGREGGSRAAELYIICQLRSHPHPLHEFRTFCAQLSKYIESSSFLTNLVHSVLSFLSILSLWAFSRIKRT